MEGTKNSIYYFDKFTDIPFQIILNLSFINHTIILDMKASLSTSHTGIAHNNSNNKSMTSKVKPSWSIRTVQHCILKH